jgi:spore coat polysaccharide biosynthesis protein SpsF
MKTKAIIQARVGSTRLKSKILKPLKNKPMICHIIDRIIMCKNIDLIILATSENNENNVLIDLINKNYKHINIIRGNEKNVLQRFFISEKKYPTDYTVRVTGDNPFISYEYIDKLIEFTIKNKLDYSNIQNLPLGMGAEIYKSDKLIKFYNDSLPDYCKEHVTPYFYEHPEKYKIKKYSPDIQTKNFRLTVDTKQDFKVAQNIYNALYINKPIPTNQILNYCNNNIQLFDFNKNIKQKSYKESE